MFSMLNKTESPGVANIETDVQRYSQTGSDFRVHIINGRGITTYGNGPKRTYENTETDFYGYRNGPEQTSVGTETDRKRLHLIPKRTSVGTRKGRVGYDRNDPNKIMYVLVGR